MTGELRFDYHKGPQECLREIITNLSNLSVLDTDLHELFADLAFGSTDTELLGESSSPVDSEDDAFGSDLTAAWRFDVAW